MFESQICYPTMFVFYIMNIHYYLACIKQNVCVNIFHQIVELIYHAAVHTAISLNKHMTLIAMGDVRPKVLDLWCIVWRLPLVYRYRKNRLLYWAQVITLILICMAQDVLCMAHSEFLMDTLGY